MDGYFTFVIPGRCPTKGSTRSFVNPKLGKVVTIADNARLKQWTKDAKWQARAVKVPMVYKPHGVSVNVLVEFVKPKTSKASAPTVRPDADKLLRACLDMLTGIAYADDSQVIHAAVMKAYGSVDQVTVRIGKVA